MWQEEFGCGGAVTEPAVHGCSVVLKNVRPAVKAEEPLSLDPDMFSIRKRNLPGEHFFKGREMVLLMECRMGFTFLRDTMFRHQAG
jgi:hypothetical protein